MSFKEKLYLSGPYLVLTQLCKLIETLHNSKRFSKPIIGSEVVVMLSDEFQREIVSKWALFGPYTVV